MKKIFASIALFLFCSMLAFAEKEMPRFEIPTAKSSAMGGTHVAYTDNVFSLLVNPAAMIRVQQFSFFAISPTLLNPQSTFGFINPIRKAVTDQDMSAMGDAADIISKQKGKIAMGMDLREFPLSIAWVANGFGFGIWNRVFVNPNVIGTNIDLNAYGDVILPFGFAFRIINTESHDLDAGFTIKPFARVLLKDRLNIIDLLDEDYDPMDDLSTPMIFGGGIDFGLLYRWDKGFSFGVTFDDVFTRGKAVRDFIGSDKSTYKVPFSLNLGAAYDVKLFRILGFTAAFDWRDFINIFEQDNYLKRNSFLNMGAGIQISFFDLFKLRLGMNECLPAIGLGIDGGPIEFGLAYYGKELGLEPGQLPVAAVDLTFAIRPNAKKRDWPWTKAIFGSGGN